MTWKLIAFCSGDAGGRPQQGIWLCVLFVSRRSYEGRNRDEWPNRWHQTLVCCFGSTQGGSQSTSGLAVYAANGQHAYAANGNCKFTEWTCSIRYYLFGSGSGSKLQPRNWLLGPRFFNFCDFRGYVRSDSGIIHQLKPQPLFHLFCCLLTGVLFSVAWHRLLKELLTLILRRSRTGTVWFYTSTSNKRTAWPKLHKVINKGLKAYV